MAGKTFEVVESLGTAITAEDLGSVGAGTSTPNLDNGCYKRVTLTAATRTIGAPTGTFPTGTRLFIEVTNSSGGAVTITWNAAFKQAATAPASTKTRVFSFIWNGTNWVQDGVGIDV